MISFIINLLRFLRAIWHGVKQDSEFRILLYVLLTLLIGGTAFYTEIEGWSIIDSLYFSVMTMSTIGYGDFVPTTTFSKIFTMVFAILSIGVFVTIVTKVVAIILDEKRQALSKLKSNTHARDATDKHIHEKDPTKK